MNNEEKIISMLTDMNDKFTDKLNEMNDKFTESFRVVNERIDIIKEDVEAIKEDIEELKENSEVTRYATNKLLDWADRVEKTVSITSSIAIPPLTVVE